LLAKERCGINFSALIVIRSRKYDGDDLSRPESRSESSRMLLGCRFALPFAAGTSVATNGVKEWATAVHLAVAQHQTPRLTPSALSIFFNTIFKVDK
jgi:hypothetical protein